MGHLRVTISVPLDVKEDEVTDTALSAMWRAFLQNPRIDVYSIACGATELGLGVQLLLQVNAQLGSGVLQLVQVGLVLLLVLNLVLQSLKGSHGSRVVIDSSASLQRLLDDGWRRNQVVRETVVQHSLDLEQVVGVLELLFVSGVSISELRKKHSLQPLQQDKLKHTWQ